MKKVYQSLIIALLAVTAIGCSKKSEEDTKPKMNLEVTTKPVTNLTAFSAQGGGDVSGSEPISERGICWGTNESPSIDDSSLSDIETITGEFELKMSMLDPSETYYVRAYAITKKGETVYGKAVRFSTKSAEPRSESNSYLVKPDDVVVIPVSRANKSHLQNQISASDVFTAELVWMDNLDVIDEVFTIGVGETGNIVALTGNSDGNAVVAAKVNGKIVWSWHIWVTDDATSIKTITMPSGAMLMDRNLGATSKTIGEIEAIGLQYQFERKDPFTASASFGAPSERLLYNLNEGFPEKDDAVGPKGLKFATENPHTFITTEWADWSEDLYRGWWLTEDGSKSVYDPSPEGWKVASLADYEGMADEHFNKEIEGGHLFIHDGQSNYFPFTGYREVLGLMEATANYGNFWVNATIEGDPGINSAYSPSYGLGGTAAVNGAPKGRALSIRCVKE